MISYIDHQLYIGGQADAASPPAFISAVLWTTLDIQLSPPPNIIRATLSLREYTEPNPTDIEMGVAWLDQHLPKHHILVACRVGFGCSPTIIIAYLCCMHGLSFEEAQHIVSQKRPGMTPLPHSASLIEQLQIKTPALSTITR